MHPGVCPFAAFLNEGQLHMRSSTWPCRGRHTSSDIVIVPVQQKNISQIAGQAVGHGCSLTRSIPDSVAFPGYQAGNWTTPPGPPAPLMAGFTPISSAPVIPSSGGFYGYQGSQSNNKAAPSNSPSPSSPSPSPSGTAGK